MRIGKIVVNGLFGIFNHDIPMRMDDRITIIHGPNGYGKTVLLKMINGLFSSHYYELRRIPFNDLTVFFNDKSYLTLKRDKSNAEFVFEYKKSRGAKKVHKVKIEQLKNREIHFPLSIIEREIPGLQRTARDSWFYVPNQEELSLDDIFDRFADRLPIPRRTSEPQWLKDIKSSLTVRVIETQRLLSFSYSRHIREYRDYPEPSQMIPAVVKYSQELSSAIQATLAEYATLSQKLDRTFPSRLLKKSATSKLTIDGLRKNLSQLEEKRSRLMAAGFLEKEKEKEIDYQELSQSSDLNTSVLAVYIEDVNAKLRVFDKLNNKIDLLVKIINNRFQYKQISIDKEKGFTIKSVPSGETVPLNSLSSGEQHELVLLYELLFKVSPNSLILIDEPELSLHVGWQMQFLGDLQEIAKLSEIDVLIATHSPQIINDRWDLTEELKGPAR